MTPFHMPRHASTMIIPIKALRKVVHIDTGWIQCTLNNLRDEIRVRDDCHTSHLTKVTKDKRNRQSTGLLIVLLSEGGVGVCASSALGQSFSRHGWFPMSI